MPCEYCNTSGGHVQLIKLTTANRVLFESSVDGMKWTLVDPGNHIKDRSAISAITIAICLPGYAVQWLLLLQKVMVRRGWINQINVAIERERAFRRKTIHTCLNDERATHVLSRYREAWYLVRIPKIHRRRPKIQSLFQLCHMPFRTERHGSGKWSHRYWEHVCAGTSERGGGIRSWRRLPMIWSSTTNPMGSRNWRRNIAVDLLTRYNTATISFFEIYSRITQVCIVQLLLCIEGKGSLLAFGLLAFIAVLFRIGRTVCTL
jgi:hypothetical protein